MRRGKAYFEAKMSRVEAALKHEGVVSEGDRFILSVNNPGDRTLYQINIFKANRSVPYICLPRYNHLNVKEFDKFLDGVLQTAWLFEDYLYAKEGGDTS